MTIENKINFQPSENPTFNDLFANKVPAIKQITEAASAAKAAQQRQQEELDKQRAAKEIASSLRIPIERRLPTGLTYIFEENGEVYTEIRSRLTKQKPKEQK
ncbi:MAG: hypothetical protein A2687_03780 [Candidatus Levybacteria bacterium RIFCSPHIGHO2_01_FULL_38_26]|nr:MAG: hypothetical protein A2687_03780 [Candidatus Levybacteria bacterium RIFCSPHIGHO2_01_FULL_38_26]